MKSRSLSTFRFTSGSVPALVITTGVLLLPGQFSLADQSAEENLAPIARVCLAGQDCVGEAIGGRKAEAAPLAVAPVSEAAAEPVAEPAAAPEAEPASGIEPASVVEPAAAAEPVALVQADDGFDLQATYQMFCFACHSTGLSGAPLPGDAEAWAPRMEKGRDEIVAIMNRGLNAMPPKGLCMSCTDDQLWELSQYMVTLEQ